MYKEDLKKRTSVRKSKASFCQREFAFVLFVVVYLSLSILLMVYSAKPLLSLKQVVSSSNYTRANQIIGEWKKGLILDLRAVSSQNCPEGYSPVINLTWPGTLSGCSCTVSSEGYQDVFVMPGKCNIQLLNYGCQNVQPQEPIKLSRWTDSKLLCQFRSSQVSFYNASSTNCTNTCGSQESKICMPSNSSCPITSLSKEPDSGAALSSNFDIGIYSLSGNGYPISSIKVSQYSFCFNGSQNRSPLRQAYLLERESRSTCPSNSSAYSIVQSKSFPEFVANNPVFQGVVQSLPSYPPLDPEINYLLGFTRSAGWKYQCRINQTYSIPQLQIRLKAEEDLWLSTVILALTALNLCIAVVLCLAWIYYHVRAILIKHEYGMSFVNDHQFLQINALRVSPQEIIQPFRLTKLFISLLLKAGLLAAYIYLAFFFRARVTWFNFGSKCGDDQLFLLTKLFGDTAQTNYNETITLTIVEVMLMGFELFYLTGRLCCSDLSHLCCVKGEEEVQQIADMSKQKQDKIVQQSAINRQTMLHNDNSSALQLNPIPVMMNTNMENVNETMYRILNVKKRKRKTVAQKLLK